MFLYYPRLYINNTRKLFVSCVVIPLFLDITPLTHSFLDIMFSRTQKPSQYVFKQCKTQSRNRYVSRKRHGSRNGKRSNMKNTRKQVGGGGGHKRKRERKRKRGHALLSSSFSQKKGGGAAAVSGPVVSPTTTVVLPPLQTLAQKQKHLTKKNPHDKCSPIFTNQRSGLFTCYPRDELERIYRLFLRRFQQNPPIGNSAATAAALAAVELANKEGGESAVSSLSSKELHTRLQQMLQFTYSSEIEWLEGNTNRELLYFKPLFAVSNNETNQKETDTKETDKKETDDELNRWLDDTHILNVLKQYTYHFPDVLVVEPTTIDFEEPSLEMPTQCVNDTLCRAQLAEWYEKGYRRIIVVFNTDVQTGKGQHWISLYIDLNRGHIYFYDSVGDAPPAQVRAFVNRMTNEYKHPLSFFHNTGRVHQRASF
jgi:hypothetical protein